MTLEDWDSLIQECGESVNGKAGAVLVRQGDPQECVYFISGGAVNVVVNDKVRTSCARFALCLPLYKITLVLCADGGNSPRWHCVRRAG